MQRLYYFALLCLFLLSSSFSLAQDLTKDEILSNLEDTAANLVDATFLLTGKLIDADGTEFPLEIDVQVIQDLQLLRADFYQPDALADNFILVDGDSLYNYIYLTNQATLLNATDPDALGGIFGSSDGAVEFSLNIESLFDGWELNVLGYEESPEGPVYSLEFVNLDSDVVINRVEGRILDGVWLPYNMLFFGSEGQLLSELIFNDFVTNMGLNADDVRELPDGVEILDER